MTDPTPDPRPRGTDPTDPTTEPADKALAAFAEAIKAARRRGWTGPRLDPEGNPVSRSLWGEPAEIPWSPIFLDEAPTRPAGKSMSPAIAALLAKELREKGIVWVVDLKGGSQTAAWLAHQWNQAEDRRPWWRRPTAWFRRLTAVLWACAARVARVVRR